MKKIWLSVLSLLTAATAFGGMATLNAEAAVEDVPEALTVSNVALGKEVTFRSLTDMSVEVDWGAYWPDVPNFYGKEGYSMTSLTDGDANWGTAQSRSPQAANTHAWALLDLKAEVSITEIKVGYLAAWCFQNVVIQVSNDPTFATGVTTVFAVTDTVLADDGTTVVYDGGQVGCSEGTRAETGWNGQIGVDSVGGGVRTYTADGVSARYVRLTNSDGDNGGAANVTTFTEIQVYAVTDGIVAPKASVASGSYESMTTVELTAAQANADIYYTLDGTYPTKNSTKYEGAIDASAWTGAVALRAITVVDGKQSEAADYIYKITVPSENKALGKEVTFRDLKDMSEISAYAYMPDGNGDAFPGTGVYNLSWGNMARLTDGACAEWTGFNAHSTAPGVRGWAFLDLGEVTEIDYIKVHMLAAWCFQDVVVQVSNDPTFATGVTTVFSCCESIVANDGTVIYNGGQVGCSEETRGLTGWNGFIGVDSKQADGNIFYADGVKARYVRVTNNTANNGGASAETVFTELQVWSKGGANFADPEMEDTVKSISAVANELAVIPGTNLDGVKAALPATLTYTTMSGATGEIALSWESADWAEMTEGNFTFTANVPAIAVDDVFDVVAENYSVTVTVQKADTSALEALISEVKALNSATYTNKTWAPLAELVATAEEASKVITITESEIANYIEQITAAKAALKELAADKTELATAIATASAIDKANYMSATVEGLDEALAAANAVNADEDASVEEATAALNGLNAVLNGLVEKGDTTALAALVNEIKAANYVEENYTELSYATLVDALADAEEIVAAAETPKTEVDAAYEQLANAKAGLVAYGNNEALSALVTACEALTAEDYTAGSYAVLSAAITEAKALLTEKVMQDVLDAAQAKLQAAQEGLISVVALKEAINSTIDESAYTAISVQVWKDAKAEAQMVLDNADATADGIAAAVAAIEAAKNALVEAPQDSASDESSDEPSDENSDTTSEAPTTSSEEASSSAGNVAGCFGSISTVFAGVALVGAAVVGLKKKED